VTIDLLVIALGVNLDPLPIVAFILVLSAKRGVLKGLGFILGWLGSLVAVIAVTLLLTGGEPLKPRSLPATTALAIKLAIGLTLIYVGIRTNRRRSQPHKARKPPKWQEGLDGMSPVVAAGIGFLVQPWTLVAAGVAVITSADIDSWLNYVTWMAFCVLCTASLLAMELYTVLSPASAKEKLNNLRAWMESHRDEAIVLGSLVLGFWLVGKSIYQLTG
jgi:hypothetical protein